ncbi:MAG: tetratricopeptide repeat protein [Hyphomonadaceae bacterium]|jgi:Tfp pilus assembly protein PilF|nr:tetratricopeptide repeat protein [Hyphomonadaceae bacterium]
MGPHASEVAALHRRGVNYQSLGEHDLAFADFDAALRIDPGFAYALISRGHLFLVKGDEKRALRDFETVLRAADPFPGDRGNHAYAYYGRGLVARRRKAYDQAIADFSEALQRHRMFVAAFVDRAETLFEQGKLAAALVDVDRALWVHPQYGLAYRIRARIYRAQGRPLEAAADEMQARLFAAFEETRGLLVRSRDKTIPVADTFSSGPGPSSPPRYGIDYPGLRQSCADDARQVLFVSMGAGSVAVRPAYAAAGGKIYAVQSVSGLTFLLGNDGCRIKVTVGKGDRPPAQSNADLVLVGHNAEPPLLEHRFYDPSQACVAATLRVRAFWGYAELIDELRLSPNQHRWNNPRPSPEVTSHRLGDEGCEIEIRISKAD